MKYVLALFLLILLSCSNDNSIRATVNGNFIFPFKLNKKWSYVGQTIFNYSNKSDTFNSTNSSTYLVLSDTMLLNDKKWYYIRNNSTPPSPPGSIYSSLSNYNRMLPNGFYGVDSMNNTILLIDSTRSETIMLHSPAIGSSWPCSINYFQNILNNPTTIRVYRVITGLTSIQHGNITYDSCWQVNTYDSLKSNIYFTEFYKTNVGLIKWVSSTFSNDTTRISQWTLLDSAYAYK